MWTLDINGEEWGEVDFPPDVEAAREADRALGRGGEGGGRLSRQAAGSAPITSRAGGPGAGCAASRQHQLLLISLSTSSPRRNHRA